MIYSVEKYKIGKPKNMNSVNHIRVQEILRLPFSVLQYQTGH